MSPVRIEPRLQPYAWGDTARMRELLGDLVGSEPCAEAWYGAHPQAPARVRPSGESLDTFLSGPGARFFEPGPGGDRELPYLLKLLAAREPLSVQVHPNLRQARAGFAEEEAAGLPRDAPTRSYRDPNDKPELLVALSEFRALCGFRRGARLKAGLQAAPELASLLPSAHEEEGITIEAMLRRWFELEDRVVEPGLEALMGRLQTTDERSAFPQSSPEYWALRAHRALSSSESLDRGILFVFLLEHLRLQPGQAIFLPAGVPHAYLEGAGLELMGSSDNVLRAGLTEKHVDPKALLQVVRFEAAAPPILSPIEGESGVEATYPVPTPSLDLRRLRLEGGRVSGMISKGPQTVLALPDASGAPVRLRCGTHEFALERGQACLLPHGSEWTVSCEGTAQVFVAGAPVIESPPSFRGAQPTALSFGTSGLRGLVEDITDLEAYVATRGFLDFLTADGDAVPGTPVAVGGDLRPSTDGPKRSILRAVARAVADAGFDVVNFGRLPTPALAYLAISRGWPSIMVTGSHIPFDRNGIKFNRSEGEVLKPDEPLILQAIERVRAREYTRASHDSMFDDRGFFRPEVEDRLPPPRTDAARAYVERYQRAFGTRALADLRIAFYEHSAVGRRLVPEILRGLGAEVVSVAPADGFVAIDTEAIASERLAELQALVDQVREAHGAIAALVSTDGDSDRPLLLGVDGRGRAHFLGGDVLGLVVARFLDADAVAVPVSANDAIDHAFADSDASVVRTRIGSPWVIAAMNRMKGRRRVGWEANGGFLTADPIEVEAGTLEALPTRDAVLPIVAALAAARREGCGLVELFERLPQRFSRAGLLDGVPRAQSQALLEAFGLRDPQLRGARFEPGKGDSGGPTIESVEGASRPATHEERERLQAIRLRVEPIFMARGFGPLESLDVLDGLRFRFSNGDVAHARPSGNAPQLRIYAVADRAERAEQIVEEALQPDGLLRALLASAARTRFVDAVRGNIELGRRLCRDGDGPGMIGTVSGTASSKTFWQAKLEEAKTGLGARCVRSLHEDLPVNQAFGLLLLWQRMRSELEPGEGALFAFVFGEGSRATPFTEAEGGQKPALSAFAKSEGRWLSTVELALRTFVPVEAFLRRSGFDGLIVKWGDEVQIPTRSLQGHDARFNGADVVRFVSMRPMSEDSAASKDWVGVDEQGAITAFIPRRPLSEMEPLADRGLLLRRDGRLVGGVNLGSIALSSALLNLLLAEFEADVNDPHGERKDRPDLDPQLFSALTVAATEDEEARRAAWAQACRESPAIERLAATMPDVLARLVRVLEGFQREHGRPARMVALDFDDQYWGDMGQHRQIFEFYSSLRGDDPNGDVTRALAGIDGPPDAQGNRFAGEVRLGPDVEVRDSVLVDVRIDAGRVEGSVLLGTEAGHLEAREAFDVQSTVRSMRMAPRSGAYKLVEESPVDLHARIRATRVFLGDGTSVLMRVEEDADLRDRATTYDQPVLENELSFREVHAMVQRAAPGVMDAEREALRSRVRQGLRASAGEPLED